MKTDQYLLEHGVKFKKHEHLPAYTAQEIAAEEHVSGNRVAKTVIVRAGGEYVMCVLPASFKLDFDKVADILGAGEVTLADETELAELFPDVEVGAEPPFGIFYDMPTLVDTHLAKQDEILFGAQTHRQAISMRFEDYNELAKPTVADIAVHG